MNTLVRRLVISNNRRLELELPSNYPTGEALLTLTFERGSREAKRSGLAALRGKYKGTIWMADDFDAPLQDFADYR